MLLKCYMLDVGMNAGGLGEALKQETWARISVKGGAAASLLLFSSRVSATERTVERTPSPEHDFTE